MGVAEAISENRWMFGGAEQHLDIVGASALNPGSPIGEVDLERSLDGGGARRSGNYQGGVCPQTGLV